MAKVRKTPSSVRELKSYWKSRFDCRIEAVTGRKSDARASRRVGRYSIAPQGSSTAGVTRPFARLARLGLSSPQPKLALARSSVRKIIEIRGRGSCNALPSRFSTYTLKDKSCVASGISSESEDIVIINHERNKKSVNDKSQYYGLSVNQKHQSIESIQMSFTAS